MAPDKKVPGKGFSVEGNDRKIYQGKLSRGESAALGHFSVSIFFGQVDDKELKNKYLNITPWIYCNFFVWFLKRI